MENIPIPAARRSLTPDRSCQILYFQSEPQRDDAFRVLVAKFHSDILHMERRDASRWTQYWIVMGDYFRDMSNVSFRDPLRATHCEFDDAEIHPYRAVLADSMPRD